MGKFDKTAKLLGAGEKMSKEAAEATLARLLPGGLSKAEHDAALERIFKNPEESKAVREALDVTQGTDRAKDLGFNKKLYHGSFSNFNEFDINKSLPDSYGGEKIYLTNSAKDASNNYASRSPEKFSSLVDRTKEILKQNPNIEESEAWSMAQKDLYKGLDDGMVYPVMLSGNHPSIDADKVFNMNLEPGTKHYMVEDASKIRSTNALFDKRYAHSPNIRALDGKQANSIADKLLGAAKPKFEFGLGSAFQQINEPLEQLNAPRNAIIEKGAQLLGKQLDISGGKVPGMAEKNAEVLKNIGDIALPASQDMVMGGFGKVNKMIGSGKKAVNAAEIAAQKLEQAIAQGYKPTAAETIAISKYKNELPVMPSHEDAKKIGQAFQDEEKMREAFLKLKGLLGK